MNEKQLAIGETTIGSKRELYNPEGLFMIEEIERLMLERCTTAREAIKLAGELVKEYLTKYTNDFARAAMHKYLELGDKFWTMFARGF